MSVVLVNVVGPWPRADSTGPGDESSSAENIIGVKLVAMPDSSSNSSGSDGSKVTPSQRHSGEGVLTLNELQDLIDEVNVVGNGRIVFRILVGSSGPEG